MIDDDPVIARTNWTPLALRGHSWPTHRLVIDEAAGRAELRPNIPLNRPLLILSELSGLILLIWQCLADGQQLADSRGPGLVWLTVLLIAVPPFALTLRTVVFDCRSGRFWEQTLAAPSKRHLEGRLSGIHAIQVIPERVYTGETHGMTYRPSFFMSYELNLVNHRGGRLNLVDHAMLRWLRQDAHRLAEFLDVPVWDLTLDSDDGLTGNELKMQMLDHLR